MGERRRRKLYCRRRRQQQRVRHHQRDTSHRNHLRQRCPGSLKKFPERRRHSRIHRLNPRARSSMRGRRRRKLHPGDAIRHRPRRCATLARRQPRDHQRRGSPHPPHRYQQRARLAQETPLRQQKRHPRLCVSRRASPSACDPWARRRRSETTAPSQPATRRRACRTRFAPRAPNRCPRAWLQDTDRSAPLGANRCVYASQRPTRTHPAQAKKRALPGSSGAPLHRLQHQHNCCWHRPLQNMPSPCGVPSQCGARPREQLANTCCSRKGPRTNRNCHPCATGCSNRSANLRLRLDHSAKPSRHHQKQGHARTEQSRDRGDAARQR